MSWNSAGLRVALWARAQNMPIQDLMALGVSSRRPVILNIEDEFKTTSPAVYEQRIRAFKSAHPTWTREIVINTVGWLYNDVDYTPMRARPFQLQVMAADMGITPGQLPQVTADCLSHARQKGLRDLSVTFQAFGNASWAWYSFWPNARSYFTGDWIGAQVAWNQWKVPV